MTSKNSMISVSNNWDGSPTEFSPVSVNLAISPDEGDLVIEIDSPYYNDAKNPLQKGRCPHLWEYEVVELFIASSMCQDVSQTPYLEIIVSPHGHWLVIGHTGQGNWEECDDTIPLEQEPAVAIDQETRRWKATISFPCTLLPEPECDPNIPLSLKWKVNAVAMHGIGASRSYLSYQPLPGDCPNFHQLDHFAPLTLYESDPERHPSSDHLGAMNLNLNLLSDLASPVPYASADFPSPKKGTGLSAPIDPASQTSETDNNNNNTNQTKAVRRPTIAQVGERLRAKPPSDGSTEGESLASDANVLEDKFSRHVHENEFVCLFGWVWKRKGWSYKRRMLILTSKPRILYINSEGTYKGSIAWTLTTPIRVNKVDDKKFDITLHDGSRVYHLQDDTQGSERWVDAIRQFLEAWQNYYEDQTGSKAPPRPISIPPLGK